MKSLVRDIQVSIKRIHNIQIEINVPENIENIKDMLRDLRKIAGKDIVMMIDKFKMMKKERLTNEFLHVIRNVYHERQE